MTNEIANDAVLLHGTSIQAIQQAQKTGYLPTADDSRSGSTDEFLYFFAKKEKFAGHPLEQVLTDIPLTTLHEQTAVYAELTAFAHSIVDLLCYRPSNTLTREWYDISELSPEAKENGIVVSALSRKIKQAESRQGVVLYIGPSIFDYAIEPDELPADEEENSVRIHLPNGLPVKHIIGVQALSDFEKRIIAELKAQTH